MSTNAKRQSDWRARTLLRAELFPIVDQFRRSNIRAQRDKHTLPGNTPEMLHVARFFLAYPKCNWLPLVTSGCDVVEDGWGYVALFGEHKAFPDIEVAAAFVALSGITSLPVFVEGHEGVRWGVAPWHRDTIPSELIEEVKSDVVALKAAGLWVEE
jgi:hypothetical protein